MAFTLIALAVGLAIGLASGGRLANAGRRSVQALALLGLGIVAEVLAAVLGGVAGTALTVCAYALLLAFALANLVLVGMGLVVVGLALNALVIVVDGGMPVEGPAAVAAGIATPAQVSRLAHLGPDLRPVGDGRHHLAGPGDRLRPLDDRLPLGPLGEVLSFGDLVLAVGLVDVAAHLTRPLRRPARAGRRLQGRERAPALVGGSTREPPPSPP
ncbi:MAG: DUF5317 family protein [Acidimicrobiales bacterium]